MTIPSPPQTQAIIEVDKQNPENMNGNITLPWAIFFNALFAGDAGQSWTPTFQNLVINGVPEVIGRIYLLSQYLALFTIQINPANDTSSNAGSTFIDNFPLQMGGNGVCFAVSGNLGSVSGMCDKPSNLIYTPPWVNVTVPLTIIGIVEVTADG